MATAKGKSHLENRDWRKSMDTIVGMLRALRERYRLAVQTGQIVLGELRPDGARFYDFRNHDLAAWFDHTRAEIISIFNGVCRELNISELSFPLKHWRNW